MAEATAASPDPRLIRRRAAAAGSGGAAACGRGDRPVGGRATARSTCVSALRGSVMEHRRQAAAVDTATSWSHQGHGERDHHDDLRLADPVGRSMHGGSAPSCHLGCHACDSTRGTLAAGAAGNERPGGASGRSSGRLASQPSDRRDPWPLRADQKISRAGIPSQGELSTDRASGQAVRPRIGPRPTLGVSTAVDGAAHRWRASRGRAIDGATTRARGAPCPAVATPRRSTLAPPVHGSASAVCRRSCVLVVLALGTLLAVGQVAPSGPVRPRRTRSASPAASPSRAALGRRAPADFGVFWEALQLVQDRYVDPSRAGRREPDLGRHPGHGRGPRRHRPHRVPDARRGPGRDRPARRARQRHRHHGRHARRRARSSSRSSTARPRTRRACGRATSSVSVDGQRVDRIGGRRRSSSACAARPGTTVTLGITHRDGSHDELPIVRAEISSRRSPGRSCRARPSRTSGWPSSPSGAGRRARRALGGARRRAPRASCSTCAATPAGWWTRPSRSPACSCRRSTVYQEQDRSGRAEVPSRPGRPVAPDLPLVVLVDYGSASSAEIVAPRSRTTAGRRSWASGPSAPARCSTSSRCRTARPSGWASSMADARWRRGLRDRGHARLSRWRCRRTARRSSPDALEDLDAPRLPALRRHASCGGPCGC